MRIKEVRVEIVLSNGSAAMDPERDRLITIDILKSDGSQNNETLNYHHFDQNLLTANFIFIGVATQSRRRPPSNPASTGGQRG